MIIEGATAYRRTLSSEHDPAQRDLRAAARRPAGWHWLCQWTQAWGPAEALAKPVPPVPPGSGRSSVRAQLLPREGRVRHRSTLAGVDKHQHRFRLDSGDTILNSRAFFSRELRGAQTWLDAFSSARVSVVSGFCPGLVQATRETPSHRVR